MAEIKLLTLLRAADGGDPNAAWRNYLAGFTADGLIRIVHNAVLPVEIRAGEDGPVVRWAGVTEGWFDTRADAEAAIARIDAHVAADAAVAVAHLLVDERLLADTGERPLPMKIIVFFKRRPDLTRAAAQAYWQGPHARLGMVDYNATDFLKRYFQNHVLDDFDGGDPETAYDGAPEFWLEGPEVLNMVGADSDVMIAIAKDEENFADRSSIMTQLVREEEIFARDAAAAGWVAA
ncbi:MAG: hypothetical protein JWR77_2184 [Rhizorhabdus sp.]|nr:hypothetical protein [Rhizorhabdus sp.]